MSTDTREGLNDLDLESRVERHLNKLADEGRDLTGVVSTYHGNGIGTASYYMGEDQVLTKSQKRQLTKIFGRGQSLPPGYKPQFKSMSHYLREGYRNTPEWKKMCDAAGEQLERIGAINKANAFSTIDSESMGALVLPEFAPTIADHQYEENDLLGETDNYSISGNGIDLPKVPGRSRKRGQRHGGVTAGWIDEGDLINVSRGKIESTRLSLKKLAVVVFLTEELIQDNSYALEQWVGRAVRSELKFLTGDALVNGTGGGMPLGYAASSAASVVGRATSSVIESADILKMYARRRPGVPLGEYKWHINQECEPALMSMTMGTSGAQQVVYIPPGGLATSPNSKLMGLDVVPLEYCNAYGTKGDIALVRMKGMVSITKGGINETASSHVDFMRDQTAIRFVQRVDARPMYDTPTKAYKGADSFEYSDFVLLE